MGTLHVIRPNTKIELTIKGNKVKSKKIEYKELDDKLLYILAKKPNEIFTFEEVAKKLKTSVEDIVKSCHRLEKNGIDTYRGWQAVVVNGKIYDEWDIICKEGLKFPEGMSIK